MTAPQHSALGLDPHHDFLIWAQILVSFGHPQVGLSDLWNLAPIPDTAFFLIPQLSPFKPGLYSLLPYSLLPWQLTHAFQPVLRKSWEKGLAQMWNNIYARPFATAAKSPSWDPGPGVSLAFAFGSSWERSVSLCPYLWGESHVALHFTEWLGGSSKRMFLKVTHFWKPLLFPLPCVPGVDFLKTTKESKSPFVFKVSPFVCNKK